MRGALRAGAAGMAAIGASVLLVGGWAGKHRTQLDVSAAASLRDALTRYGRQFPAAVRYSFAGSGALAAQIEQGVRPDVFAAANEQLPDMLFARGLVYEPVAFARNRLVLAVPVRSAIATLEDLERPGVTIAVGDSSVPVGSYTAQLLDRLPASARRRLLANIRDREPDVTGIVGKLLQGAVDAGVLYASDVAAASGRLRAIELPAALRPKVAYAAAIVRDAPHRALAQAFIAGLLAGAGREDLVRAGLSPPDR